jgi:hypothetical protein
MKNEETGKKKRNAHEKTWREKKKMGARDPRLIPGSSYSEGYSFLSV